MNLCATEVAVLAKEDVLYSGAGVVVASETSIFNMLMEVVPKTSEVVVFLA